MLAIFHQDAICRIGSLDNLTVAAWFNAPGLDQLRALDALGQKLRARHKGAGYLGLILSGKPNFSSEVRAEVARQTALRDGNLATAHVVLVPGLFGTAVRAFLSTTQLMARPTHPVKVFGDTEQAVEWIIGELSSKASGPSRDALLKACMDVQKRE